MVGRQAEADAERLALAGSLARRGCHANILAHKTYSVRHLADLVPQLDMRSDAYGVLRDGYIRIPMRCTDRVGPPSVPYFYPRHSRWLEQVCHYFGRPLLATRGELLQPLCVLIADDDCPPAIRVSLTESALCRLPNRQRARVSVIEHRTILCDQRQIMLDRGRVDQPVGGITRKR